jgi:hypothetical protein
VIFSAITEVTAEGEVKVAVDQRERGALILDPWIERFSRSIAGRREFYHFPAEFLYKFVVATSTAVYAFVAGVPY